MKYFFLAVCASLALAATSCRTGYDITLTSGGQITGVSKPKFDNTHNVYVFKDASGQEHFVPAMRVSVIEPHEEPKKREYGANQKNGNRTTPRPANK